MTTERHTIKQLKRRGLTRLINSNFAAWLDSILARKPPSLDDELIILKRIEKPYHARYGDGEEIHIVRNPGIFGWSQGGEQYELDGDQLREQLTPILERPQFKTPLSDHTFIRVNILIDRLVNFRKLVVNLSTGEIKTKK